MAHDRFEGFAIDVREDDVYRYLWQEYTPEEWAYCVSLRSVSQAELEELRELQKHHDRLQSLLKEIHSRPAIEIEYPF